MSRKPLDRDEQLVFFRTIALASLVACVGFTIYAVMRGEPLTERIAGLLPPLIATGLLFGWFGKIDREDRDAK